MIAFVILAALAILMATIPWRRLPRPGQLWALAACLNTVVFFTMPATAATSPWRPVVGRVLTITAGISLGLLVLGLMLRVRMTGLRPRTVWLIPLVLAALPAAFYAFFWVIGPVY